MWIELSIFVIIGFILFYRWATRNYDFFKNRRITSDEPIFLLGSGKDVTLRKKSILDHLCELYAKHDGIIYGIFDNCDPVYLIRDPELIKQIMIKDFDHFVNRRSFSSEPGDNLLFNSLFAMENERWRDMRTTLSPAFTGSKMRQMFELIVLVIDESMEYLKDLTKNIEDQEEGIEIDVKDFTTRLTNDIIASTAFGLQINSFKNRDNEFYVKALKATNFTGWQQIKMLIVMLVPKIGKIFKIDMMDKDFTNYFMRLVLDAMKYRVENNIHRPDMINLLMEAKGMIPTDDNPKTHFREWSDVEVVAQCFLFFFAGFEPSSNLMSFAAHELMEHAEVQEKLYQEIQQVNKELKTETVTYEILQKMPYMDMVVSEILRKWPVTLVTDRTCTKDFLYESQGERLDIKKGEIVRVAMCAIQRDPKYYTNPDEIDPERFNEENKSKIDSGTYLPFGLGPRNCIAKRFAILETKAFLFNLLRNYRLEASAKTMKPLKLCTKSVQLKPANGFWLQLKPRK